MTGIGLIDLSQHVLSAENQGLRDRLSAESLGPPAWRARKRAELHEILALSERAPRMDVMVLDIETDLKAVIRLHARVPTRPGGEGPLVVEEHVVLGISYGEEALVEPQPGYAFVTVLAPRDFWH